VDVVEGDEDDVDDVEGAIGTENGDENGGDGGRGQFPSIQKISTTFEYPPLLFAPPPKNILF
jgi:hypothetical protein